MFSAFSLYLIACFCPLDLSFAGPAIPRYTETLLTILQPGKRSDSLHLLINGNTTEKKRETLHFLATVRSGCLRDPRATRKTIYLLACGHSGASFPPYAHISSGWNGPKVKVDPPPKDKDFLFLRNVGQDPCFAMPKK